MRKIIIEGPDGSGKSTLASILAEKLGMDVYHSGGPVGTKKELLERIEIQLSQKNCIIDRCSVFSEPVYGTIIRGHSLLSKEDFKFYIKKMVKEGFFVIYCIGNGDVQKGKKWKSKNHMNGIIENRNSIYRFYSKIMDMAIETGLKGFTWDFENLSEEAKQIEYKWLEWFLK